MESEEDIMELISKSTDSKALMDWFSYWFIRRGHYLAITNPTAPKANWAAEGQQSSWEATGAKRLPLGEAVRFHAMEARLICSYNKSMFTLQQLQHPPKEHHQQQQALTITTTIKPTINT